jgi:histidyl-tRNA synthetase
MKLEKVKGTKDMYPEDFAIQQYIFSKFKETAEKYGFKQVEAPAFEYMSVFRKKAGPEIDKQIFVLKKRGKEEIGLRFDITVPITRMYINKQKALTKPVKWFYLTRMWRYEQPQQGRLREFYQFGIELFGSEKSEADAEVINLAIDSLKSLGLTNKDFIVKINNRKLLEGLLDFIPKNKIEEVMRLIDKSEKIGKKNLELSLKDLKVDAKKVIKILETKDINKIKIENEKAKQGLEELNSILKLLDKKYLEVDLSTARGLSYYTGTVFEIFDKKGKFRAICGGGRYNDLIEKFGGEKEPATGFGLGLATLGLLLEEKNLIPKIEQGPDYYVAPVNEKVYKEALSIADKLRKKAKVEIDLMGRNLSNQFKYANSINAKNIVIIGEKDLAKKEVTIKDLKTGKEKKVKLDQIV